jgi:hypothetical protein
LAASVGIAFTPTLAEASSAAPSDVAQSAGRGVSPLPADVGMSFKTFTSPASKSVRVSKAGGTGHGSVAGAATTGAGPNPDLGISVTSENISAFGIRLFVTPSNYTNVSGQSLTITVNWGDGTDSTVVGTGFEERVDHSYSKLGHYTATVTADDGQGDVVTNQVPAQTAGSEFVPYTPTRILDTRNAIGAPAAPIGPGGTLKLQVVGAGPKTDPIPSGITAVVLNVTVAGSTSNGFLTVFTDQGPTGAAEPTPTTSSVNYGPGQIVPNQVVAPVGPNGVVDIENNSSGKTEVLADVSGYFLPTNVNEWVPITPSRILDTRNAIGAPAAAIPANGSLTFKVDGAPGLPPSGIAAIAANLTVAGSQTNGFISAYPEAGSVPNVSNVNYAPGQIVPDMAIVPVNPTTGEITIHNSSKGWVQVLVDVFGYFTEDQGVIGESAYLPAYTPYRWLDTRDPGNYVYNEPIVGDTPYGWPLTADTDWTGVVFNATIVGPTRNGYLTLYPYDWKKPGANPPRTSNLNFGPGQIVANMAIVSPGTDLDTEDAGYDLGVYLGSSGESNLVLDVNGIFEDD